MRVLKALSNNAVLAVGGDGQEVVAMGRGVGHARLPGDELDSALVERVFTATGSNARDQLTAFVAEVPLECVRAAVRVADLAHERLGVPVTQALILPLADHLAFALRRRHQGIQLALPLAWEVSQLYPQELAVGREAITLASRELKIADLDPDEAVAIAMHLVNSQFTTPGMSAAMRMTETITRVLEVIEGAAGIRIDPQAMSTSRFVTHLRYLFVRLANDTQFDEPYSTLADAIANAHPEAMGCADKVAYLVTMDTAATLSRNEIAYLALHIARLLWTAREGDPVGVPEDSQQQDGR